MQIRPVIERLFLALSAWQYFIFWWMCTCNTIVLIRRRRKLDSGWGCEDTRALTMQKFKDDNKRFSRSFISQFQILSSSPTFTSIYLIVKCLSLLQREIQFQSRNCFNWNQLLYFHDWIEMKIFRKTRKLEVYVIESATEQRTKKTFGSWIVMKSPIRRKYEIFFFFYLI